MKTTLILRPIDQPPIGAWRDDERGFKDEMRAIQLARKNVICMVDGLMETRPFFVLDRVLHFHRTTTHSKRYINDLYFGSLASSH